MAIGCDQCVWPVSVASRCGRWVRPLGGALNNVISGQCVFKAYINLTSLPCFRTFFQLHLGQPYIAFHFFQKCFFILYIGIYIIIYIPCVAIHFCLT